MATKRQGLQLAQTAFPDYFSEPINTSKTTPEKDYIGVQDFVRLPSCSKQNSESEKHHKATYREIFEWFQKEYGLPNFVLGSEPEIQVTKPSTEGIKTTTACKMEPRHVPKWMKYKNTNIHRLVQQHSTAQGSAKGGKTL